MHLQAHSNYYALPLILLQHVKINQKHNQLVRELSDLINQPSPSSSHHSVVDNSRVVIREKINDKSMQSFESRLAGKLYMYVCVCVYVCMYMYVISVLV